MQVPQGFREQWERLKRFLTRSSSTQNRNLKNPRVIDLINKGYNIKPQGVYREDAGLYFRNVKMQNFGHDVLVELEVILGYELPKSCVLQY